MKKSILFITIILFCQISSATIINVPGDQPTIQQAIDVAFPGDTVLVAGGTYYENINFKGKNITVASHFILENDLSFIESTIIDGSQPVHPDTASCVLFVTGEDSTAVLAGFTITGGTGTVWEDEHSPGLFFTEGGGVLIQYAEPTIRNNVIQYNEATNMPEGVTSAGGGAIRAGDSNPHILNNMILYNQGRYGAGIVLNYSGAVLKNNIIAYNTGGKDYGGGGIWCLGNGDKPKIIENNSIVKNHSQQGGGGIRIWSAAVDIINSIFWGNTAFIGDQIQGNGNVTYSCIQDGYPGEGNIEDDPLFEPGNLILSDNSPCIDMGSSDPMYDDPEDEDNPGNALYPAKGGLRNDMGAYGGPGSMAFPGVITSTDEGAIVIDMPMISVYPNPSNGLIYFKIPELVNEASIMVFDLSGKLVASQSFSQDLVSIDTRHWEAGLYIYSVISISGYFTGKFTVK